MKIFYRIIKQHFQFVIFCFQQFFQYLLKINFVINCDLTFCKDYLELKSIFETYLRVYYYFIEIIEI